MDYECVSGMNGFVQLEEIAHPFSSEIEFGIEFKMLNRDDLKCVGSTGGV